MSPSGCTRGQRLVAPAAGVVCHATFLAGVAAMIAGLRHLAAHGERVARDRARVPYWPPSRRPFDARTLESSSPAP